MHILTRRERWEREESERERERYREI